MKNAAVTFILACLASPAWAGAFRPAPDFEPAVAIDQRYMLDETAAIVSRHRGVFTSPPQNVPTTKVPDGPLLGNGDVGVVISGPPERQRFWISKCDFWLAREGNHRGGSPRPIGGLDVFIPAMRNARYHVEQLIKEGLVVATFTSEDSAITMRSWICDSPDILLVEITASGKAVGVEADLWAKTGEGTTTKRSDRRMHLVTRGFDMPELKWPCAAAMALRTIGANPEPVYIVENSGKYFFEGAVSNSFAVEPGRTVTLAVSVCTNFDAADYEGRAVELVRGLSPDRIETLRKAHETWWRLFWSKSFVETGDPVIDKHWYGSLYLMASCSRNGQFPPGLLGNWVTSDRPAWHADYHTNYNHQAPWWGVYSANHVELSESYDAPVMDFMERARYYAKRDLACRGVYYPVGIGPKGLETTLNPPHGVKPPDGIDRGHFLGQKSNAAYLTVNMIMRFYHTYDLDYARRTAYPYILEVVDFWEDYLKFEDGRYVSREDHLYEINGNVGTHVNNLLSLALVRLVFKAALDMGVELGRDADRYEKWRHILDNISGLPLLEREGKTVFRFAEENCDWRSEGGDGLVAVQHIWPTGIIGPESDGRTLQIARNHIEQVDGWTDDNGFCTFYTAAARVGYDPDFILARLRQECLDHAYPNLHVFHGGGGIEECSGVVSCINQMMLSGHEGVLRVFGNWPAQRDARFARLRSPGAFLFSSRIKDGAVQYIFIESEKGRPCVLHNPWPGEKAVLWRDGRKDRVLDADILRFDTSQGERLWLQLQ